MAVRLLYEALDLQCRQCGTRYPRSDSGRSKMDLHLDWHFRQNRRAKEKAKKAISRDWFVDEDEWVLEQEVNVRDRKGSGPRIWLWDSIPSETEHRHLICDTTFLLRLPVPTLFFDNEDVTVSEPVEAVSNIPAIAGETNPSCKICTEVLEKFYDEESDDWMLRGAVRVDGNLYHQVCYKDGQGKTSSRTPTPPLVGETPATEGEGLVDAVKAEKSALGSQDMVIQSIPS
ncbi:hypothetical protein HKX48_004826 [Thoreauomyces humboldtii]|nr:hypothetical protein HKX48_004826 [Thoreauomyces humboldtii]